MENKKEILKLKIFLLVILSNCCSYIIALNNKPEINEVKSSIIRPDYVEVKIDAQLKVPLERNKPITISNKKRSLYIPYAFYIRSSKKEFQNSSLLANKELASYTISIHKQYFKLLVNSKELVIYPQLDKTIILNSKRNKGENYEIAI